MPDLVAELLAGLEKTKQDPHAQSALTAAFALDTRPAGERETVRRAFDAAAVLHWFDATLLAHMLESSEEEAAKLFEVLKNLPFVERYGRSERDLRNVHESTRLGWRKQLAHESTDYFRRLSARAAECFSEDTTVVGRIEWIYHRQIADPKTGAKEL